MTKLAGLVLLALFFLAGCPNRNTVPCECPSTNSGPKKYTDPFNPL